MRAIAFLTWFVANIGCIAACWACALGWFLGRTKGKTNGPVLAVLFFTVGGYVCSQFVRALVFSDRSRLISEGFLIWAATDIAVMAVVSVCVFFWMIGWLLRGA